MLRYGAFRPCGRRQSMANLPRRKTDAARRANQVIRTRTVLVMALLGVVTFGALFLKLFNLQIRVPGHDLRPERASSGGVRYG